MECGGECKWISTLPRRNQDCGHRKRRDCVVRRFRWITHTRNVVQLHSEGALHRWRQRAKRKRHGLRWICDCRADRCCSKRWTLHQQDFRFMECGGECKWISTLPRRNQDCGHRKRRDCVVRRFRWITHTRNVVQLHSEGALHRWRQRAKRKRHGLRWICDCRTDRCFSK